MTLLNSLLALGALAFTIPLAIHLLHRSRFTTIDWGAWHLLDSVIRVNRRRMQLTHLLLLLLRCLIPILLAFCLARPVLTGFRALPGDAPRTVVIAVDDSRSMDAAVSGQPTRLQAAKDGLCEFLKTLSRRDEVILVQSTTVQSPPSSMGAAEAIEKITRLKANGGPVDLAILIDAAVGAAQQSSHSQSTVLLASDFQSVTVGKSTMNSLDGITQRLSKLDPAPTVHFWDFGAQSELLSNVSVESVTVDSPAVVAGRSVQFSARLRNAADLPTGEMRIVWAIDGIALPPRMISLESRASATGRLSHRFDASGVREVTVSIEKGDSLAADNRRTIAVDVMPEIKVLLVDGKPSNRPLEGQADFLSIALSPFAFGGDDQPDSVKALVIRDSQIESSLKKETPDIIMLANVRPPSASLKTVLADFVMEGGSLVVFDGDQLNRSGWNQPWNSSTGSWELPAVLGDVIGSTQDQEKPVASFAELNPQYTPWKLLSTGDQLPLADVEIFAYRNLILRDPSGNLDATSLAENEFESPAETGAATGDTAETFADASVLLRFNQGSPAVVLAKRGRGQVLQFAVPCDASWTTLPLRLSYLPMMQQMVLDLAGRSKSTTLDVGQPMSVLVAELNTDTEHRSPGNTVPRYSIQTPGESEMPILPSGDSDGELQWPKTQTPGTYVFRAIRSPDESESRKLASGKRSPKKSPPASEESSAAIAGDYTDRVTKTIRVVEVPASESQLRSAAPDRLAAVAQKVGANIMTQLSEIKEADQTHRFGREIWRWILVALLVAMVGELFLQQRLMGRRSKAGVS